MKKLRFLLICIFLALIISSCTVTGVELGGHGILANEEVVSSVKKEMEDRENSLLAEEGDVFWTPSGTAWHCTHRCRYIVNSKTVYHGTVEEARLDGKKKACSACTSSVTGGDAYAELEENPLMPGDVFFTRDGAHWHSDINCEALLGEEKIYYGSVEKARALGKIIPCEDCAEKSE